MQSYVNDIDRQIYAAAGFGSPIGLGSRPALVVIDVQHRTVGANVAVLEAIESGYSPACGERAHRALPNVAKALSHFRHHGLPVVHAYVAPKTVDEHDMFQRINPTVADVKADGYMFHPAAAPVPGEPLVPKEAPSAFFGTPLVRLLVQRGVDAIVLAGCTTSGCVRASAVDGFSYNYAVTVLSDAVYDRTELSHQVGLFELSQKYADVMTVDELITKSTTEQA